MTNKILKSILTAAMTVLLASLLIITGVLYGYFENVQKTQLKDELHLAAKATEQMRDTYLESVESNQYRLTWIDLDGTVLFDSHAEADSMENHGDREEIKEALERGNGSSVRHSVTLTEKTIYEAVRLEDGTVLRISVSRASALVLILGMAQPIAIVIFLAICLSVWLANRMAKQAVEPLNELNLDDPLGNEAYEELSPLLHRLYNQQREIKRQMQTLEQKEQEFDQITRNMSEALVLLDPMERILSINPAAIALFQTNAGCVGENLLMIERKQDMITAVETAKQQGKSSFRANRNGKDYQFELSRINSEKGVCGLVILAYDITDQVNAEQNRRDFTANVSHELKTPLQSIIGSAELIENGIVKTEDLPRFVGHIRKQAARLLALIDDIIRLSQMDAKAEMPMEKVSLYELSEEVFDMLADAAKVKEVTLNLNGARGVMNGVRRLLYEIVYNLCDNAVKYNKPGGSVNVTILEEENGIRLEVQDDGMGIPVEHQEKVFERFYRIDKSHSKQSGGTGLGLSIVKHAVEYHQGKIEMKSELEKGTTISVLF